jgi:4-hydroxythreonine-4-phosphate dehydrogenase
MKKAESKGILCVGPYPSDGFFGSGNFDKFDGVLAMYHDQGLIPFKTVSMDTGVNFTAGLSVIRTSPDHGTAYDIVGKNLASEESFRQALYLAYDVYQSRKWNDEIKANPLKTEQRVERGGRVE